MKGTRTAHSESSGYPRGNIRFYDEDDPDEVAEDDEPDDEVNEDDDPDEDVDEAEEDDVFVGAKFS